MSAKNCVECKTVMEKDGVTIKSGVIELTSDNEEKNICFGCADKYYIKKELELYEQWCKQNNKKPNKRTMDKIRRNK